MTDISFKSLIRPVCSETFNRETKSIANNVTEWTINGAKKGIAAKTDRIMDCTAIGITDGQTVFLMHIIPELSSNKAFFSSVVNKIKNFVDMTSKYLQALLVGSKNYSRESVIGYNNFARFLKENKIPYSELKGGDSIHEIAYNSTKDEWLISNFDIDSLLKSGITDPEKLLNFGFDKVKINKLDEIV